MLAVMAHQRSAAALRVTVFARRKAVIDQQRDAALEMCRQGARKSVRRKMNLRGITGSEFKTARDGEHGSHSRPCAPVKRTGGRGHTEFVDAIVACPDDVHWHCIEHFIADYQCAARCRQGIEPCQARRELRQFALQQRALALSQISARFEDKIALRQAVKRYESLQQTAREPATAGA